MHLRGRELRGRGGWRAGSTTVVFSSDPNCGATSYQTQWYGGSASLAGASDVGVDAGSTTAGIGATLAGGAEIAGSVTNGSASGVGNVEVDLYDANGYITEETCTSSGGSYTLSGLSAGSYFVGFDPSGGDCAGSDRYLAQYYAATTGGRFAFADATAIAVSTGSNVSGIDATLANGGTISGTVHNSSSTALPDVEVDVYDENGYHNGGACTDASGGYAVTGLATGQYTVTFTPVGDCGDAGAYLEAQYHSGATVSVSAGATAGGVDVQLASAGSISGTVSGGGGALAGVEVDIYSPSGSDAPLASTCTDGAGDYSFVGLDGSFQVGFCADRGLEAARAREYRATSSSTKATLARALRVRTRSA